MKASQLERVVIEFDPMFLNQCNVLIAKDWGIQATAAEHKQDAYMCGEEHQKDFCVQHQSAVLIVEEHTEQTQ